MSSEQRWVLGLYFRPMYTWHSSTAVVVVLVSFCLWSANTRVEIYGDVQARQSVEATRRLIARSWMGVLTGWGRVYISWWACVRQFSLHYVGGRNFTTWLLDLGWTCLIHLKIPIEVFISSTKPPLSYCTHPGDPSTGDVRPRWNGTGPKPRNHPPPEISIATHS